MAPDRDPTSFSPDDVQTLENTLKDTPTSDRTRRWLLSRAALGVGAAAAAVPVTGVLAQSSTKDTPKTVGTIAVTAEALAVTYLTQVVQKNASQFPTDVGNILKAALTAEQDHYQFLSGAGFNPKTTKFWIPDSAIQAKNAAMVIEIFETIFVNAYLIGATVFAKAKNGQLARYAAEIAGVEAEHRTLARQLQGKLPDNLAFESYRVHDLDAIVAEIKAAGVGIGAKGATPGNFYTYSAPPSSLTVPLAITAPDGAVPFPSITAAAAGGQPAMTG